MDRYVLVLSYCRRKGDHLDDFKPLEKVKQIYDRLGCISCQEYRQRVSAFPACSLSGSPSGQRWYFAVQAFQGFSQFCSSEWEEVGTGPQKSDSEEESPGALQLCLSSLLDQESEEQPDEQSLTELLEEAAEGVHLLSDQLPPPGKALVDVLLLTTAPQSPALKDLLPLMGALKHLLCWHTAQITVVTQHTDGWQKVASSLSAAIVAPAELDSCVDHREQWRGALLIREKKCASELRFEGFSLRAADHQHASISLLGSSYTTPGHQVHPEVFHYYKNMLDLIQLVDLTEVAAFLISNTQFQLSLSGNSKKSKLLLDQLASLHGKVGALFCLSCVVTPVVQPPASQLASQQWRETLGKRPRTLPVPETEVKGERAHYLLLVQGSEDSGGACKATMLRSANQINGAAAVATVNGLLREKSLLSSELAGNDASDILRSLPCLHGDDLLSRERRVTRAQKLVLEECFKRQVEGTSTASIPANDIQALLSLARAQYLKMNPTLPAAAPCLPEDRRHDVSKAPDLKHGGLQSDWPERSVLHNVENLQKRRQKKRFGLLSGPSSSDSLLGPKDSHRLSSASLDARELLKHFTADGMPAGELQPLAICRGNNMFQFSPDLSPGTVSQMPFSKASAHNYHGLEFCLDHHRALDRDLGLLRLQSRLIRYETQTTCSKEPCPIPFALSPAPLPAVTSEPGSVPDGETLLQNTDVARLKRRSRDQDMMGGYSHKRLAKSESCDSLSSSSSGTHPSVRSLRQQPIRTKTASGSSPPTSLATRHTSSGNPPVADKSRSVQQRAPLAHTKDQSAKESRSQKHHRMLKEVVTKTLAHHGITAEHKYFSACSQRLFEISKFYLKDLKTSRGLHEEMKKAAGSNAKQVIDWVLEKSSKKQGEGK